MFIFTLSLFLENKLRMLFCFLKPFRMASFIRKTVEQIHFSLYMNHCEMAMNAQKTSSAL